MAKKKKVEECCEEVAETPKASHVVVHDVKPALPLWAVRKELDKYLHLYDDLWYWDGDKFEKVKEVCSVGDKLVVK